MTIDQFSKSEIEDSLHRIGEILESNIFAPEKDEHPLVRSAFIELASHRKYAVHELPLVAESSRSRMSGNDHLDFV